ncbi:PH domain-containing protein [Streptomyces misionensis]|uniref:PH domain-containing protein n=1 Tax=Streptomyces misionensis TaxID=67331 RepID=UPI0033ADF0D2
MADHAELSLRWGGQSARWWTAALALVAVAAAVAASLGVPGAEKLAIFAGVVGVGVLGCGLGMLRRRVEAGPKGLRLRAVLRWRRLDWDEIVRLEGLRVAAVDSRVRSSNLRVVATLRDGSTVPLPVPWVGADDMGEFERQLSRLRAVQHRYARGNRRA